MNQKHKTPSTEKPNAYQKGYIEFYKLRFKVTPGVLIPRPETELLVDEVLNFIKTLNPKPSTHNPFTILDIGTGSGAIAISLAKNLSTCQVDIQIIASDVSVKALKIAKQNAKLHGVEDRISFTQSDLLSAFSNHEILAYHPKGGNLKLKKLEDTHTYTNTAQYHNITPDIIVTNLPYIPTGRIAYLDSSVKDFEPHIALDGGKDGFELYRRLFQQITKFTKFSLPPRRWKPKLIVGEIDYTHGELAILEAQKYFPQAEVEVKKDLAHLQRILIIKSKPKKQKII